MNQIKIAKAVFDDDILIVSGLNPLSGYRTTQCSRNSVMGQLATEVLQLRNQVTTLTSLLDTEKRKNLRPVVDSRTTPHNSEPTGLLTRHMFPGEPVTEQKPYKRRVRLLSQDKVVRVAVKYTSNSEGAVVAVSLSNSKMFWIQFDSGKSGWYHENQILRSTTENQSRMLRGRTDG